MEINGIIYRILRQEEVTLNDGSKKMKGGFVISTDGEYPKKVAFELFGEERLSLLAGLGEGNFVKVNFIPVSFEGKDGRYYSTLRCTNVFPLVSGVVSNDGNATQEVTSPQGRGRNGEDSFDDLAPDEAIPFDSGLPYV